MKLYGFWRSIASYRVRVALHLKGLEFDEPQINLLEGHQFTPEFLAINPSGAVPALDIDGHILTQSMAIMEFLEERYPNPPLLPADPFERAEARALAQATVSDAHPLFVPRVRKYLATTFGADEHAVHDWARHWLDKGLQSYEVRLGQRPPAPFVFGAAPGIADIAIKSHAVASGLFGVDMAPYERVRALSTALDGIEAFQRSKPAAPPTA
ncbi:MAG TPA: maleylacetoacetate isomerase [Paracoccaceae bacterium]|nr:maleylacetoacetate isomerase [Paracoccaceae bacterium]